MRGTNMFDHLISQFRPAAQALGVRAEEYTNHALRHLEVIAQNTTPDDDPSAQVHRQYPRWTAIPANAAQVELFQVPSGQTWYLEAITSVGLAVGTITFTLRNGPGGTPLYAQNGTSPGTSGGNGVVFAPGHVVTIDNGGIGMELALQVRVEVKQPRRKVRTRSASLESDVQPPTNPDQSTGRHFAENITEGTNVHGERRDLVRLG